jgi:8-oxo-dGTP diphosphatase
MSAPDTRRIDCVGVICFRGDEVLLIRRANPPRAGEWSLPGGRIEDGESETAAALRELAEETGVSATLGDKIAIIDIDFEGFSYRLHDYVAVWTQGEPRGADDALDARFVRIVDIGALGMWPKTNAVIRDADRARRSAIRTRSVNKGSLP